jgi:hypothetical protein
MTVDLLSYGVPTVIAIVAGAVAGALAAWRLHRGGSVAKPPVAKSDYDQYIDAEIDLAAVRWQESNHLPPEAAAVMAKRLKTLHTIGARKGWFE